MVNQEAYHLLQDELRLSNTKLIAVSKFKMASDINTLYMLGQRDFGENYVQELVEKQQQLSQDIQWHFIGHLQSNKVKYIAPFIHCIHSVDSFKLIQEINKQALKNNRIIDILLQVYVGDETTKYGMDEHETMTLLEYYTAQLDTLQNVRIRGLMGMASNIDNEDIIAKEFDTMRQLFNTIKMQYFFGTNHQFDTLSMGMSSDYVLAIANGSNMVRIGSTLFGRR